MKRKEEDEEDEEELSSKCLSTVHFCVDLEHL
jgi:hypothetical protein